MAMPYKTEVRYEKPVLPDQSRGEKRKDGSINQSVHRVRTSTKLSASGMKQSTLMLLITNGRLGHSDVHIDDDDFVDPLPKIHQVESVSQPTKLIYIHLIQRVSHQIM
ncbi:Hypothetical predicted protein [Olea europaea subsp. europaea]|uniref:Uncharacterized protein n=1 Tax=Olea europaea subsp. europaea TaxID=158383 RepID=A0A8S0S2U6_OLEEU|nr:Hypothetical predicted protein [Olea europaea subsp. europaea]